MKITIELLDSLLEEARWVAASEGRTVSALVEEGLRILLAKCKRRGEFRLRKASFKGEGLQPHVTGASWERIRNLAYERHGA